MKQRFLYFALLLIVLASCKKQSTSADGLQIKLSATIFYKNGSTEKRTDRSGAFNTSSYSQVINEGGINKFLINLGVAGSTNTLPVFGISIIFNRQTTVQKIIGTYSFPADYTTVNVMLRNEVTPTVTESLFFPTRGTINLSYDSISKKINGSIQDLEFSIISNDPYNRYRVTVEGTFAGVPVN